jgi:hypothetical protein
LLLQCQRTTKKKPQKASACVIPATRPQISPLRCAPVETTILFKDGIPRFQERYEILAATELSSRPERSVVERSAVLWRVSHTLFSPDSC